MLLLAAEPSESSMKVYGDLEVFVIAGGGLGVRYRCPVNRSLQDTVGVEVSAPMATDMAGARRRTGGRSRMFVELCPG